MSIDQPGTWSNTRETSRRYRCVTVHITSNCPELLEERVAAYERSYPRGGYGTHFQKDQIQQHTDKGIEFLRVGERSMSCD